MKERRKFSRAGKNSVVEFKELEFPLTEKDYSNSNIKNISGNGLLFESKNKFDIGASLHLKISLIGWDKDRPGFNIKAPSSPLLPPVSVIGTVVRIEEVKKDSLYDIGIKFTNIDKDDEAGIISFLNKNLENKE